MAFYRYFSSFFNSSMAQNGGFGVGDNFWGLTAGIIAENGCKSGNYKKNNIALFEAMYFILTNYLFFLGGGVQTLT